MKFPTGRRLELAYPLQVFVALAHPVPLHACQQVSGATRLEDNEMAGSACGLKLGGHGGAEWTVSRVAEPALQALMTP